MGMKESEFGGFLQSLSSRVTANVGGPGTGGVAIARYRGAAGDESFQAGSEQHILMMCAARPARFEARKGLSRYLIYSKQPGALSLVPAGVCPPLRALSDFELVVFALDQPFVEKVDAELECRPVGDFRLQTNIQDRAARQLMRLLVPPVISRMMVSHYPPNSIPYSVASSCTLRIATAGGSIGAGALAGAGIAVAFRNPS